MAINIFGGLSTADLIVFFAVLGLTVAAAIYGDLVKKNKTSGNKLVDYMIMGRMLSLPMFTATLVATWYGGIFGVTEIAFNHGIYNFITQGVFWYATYLIFALFLVSRARRFGALTLPELVKNMFGVKAGYVAGVFNFFNVVPIAYTISLGLFINTLFGLPVWLGCLCGTALVCAYSAVGGLRAVVFSDLVQFFAMCIAVFLVIYFSFNAYGGLDYLQANLPTEHFSLTGGQSLSTMFVWGFIALSTLVDPNFYQRCFAADSDRSAKFGILAATVIWCLFDLCTTFGAMYARAALPEAEAGSAYLTYALQTLPDGLRGLFLAGILATILSTMDSYIFLAGNTLAYDLAPRRWKGHVALNRLGVVLVGVIAVTMSSLFEGSIKAVWKTIGSYSAGCLLLPVMLGYLFPGRFSEHSFLLGVSSGVIAITLWRTLPLPESVSYIDDLYVGALMTALGMAAGQKWLKRGPSHV